MAIETVEDFSQIIPGAHTASFFGLAASIDLRGALADTHFRGMRRLVSAGGWQSLIRAADRVDVVRGPATPIHGAGSISGYINLVPKTARADEDRFIEAPRGDVAVRVGSWNRYGFEGQRGGPARLFGKPAGYHVFGLWEDAGSYYREHPGQRQLMLQGTLVVDLRGDVWIEAGQQYQRWRGAENAGWNRVDQKLIDEGLYLSGEPLVNLDSDRDGRISQREVLAVSPRNRLAVFQPYGQTGLTFASEAERQALRLNPDTLRRVPIGAEHCLCAPSDSGAAESLAAYFDVFAELGRVTLRQKLFLDYADRHIVASYGFSQQHRTVLVRGASRSRISRSGTGPDAHRRSGPCAQPALLRHAGPPGLLLRVLQPQGHQQAAVPARPARLGLRQSRRGSPHCRCRDGLAETWAWRRWRT